MKENTTILLTNSSEKLDQAPHVLAQLIDLLRGTLPFSPAQYQQIEQHLAECIHCQVFVELALLSMLEDAQAHHDPTEPAQQLLKRWSRITHATCKGDIPAYVDTLMEQGEEKACTRFPLLAEHMCTCQDCQAEVRDLCSWLDQLS